jgi:hypothetical protein
MQVSADGSVYVQGNLLVNGILSTNGGGLQNEASPPPDK